MVSVVEKIRYVRLGVTNAEAVADFVSRMVGLQPIEAPDGLKMFRSDFRDHSLSIYQSGGYEQTLALSVRDDASLGAVAGRLEAAGYSVKQGSDDELAARRCKAMVWFTIRGVVRIELVVRPLDSGWRYFGSRDAGIVEFFGVAFASTDAERDIRLWTEILGGSVSDYIGDGAYISIDDEHHRIAIHPSNRDALLEMQFRVEGLDQLMQNKYFLETSQVAVVQGPGRRPASGQLFLSYRSPAPLLFGLVAEGDKLAAGEARRPRQFPLRAESFCAWGSMSAIQEFSS